MASQGIILDAFKIIFLYCGIFPDLLIHFPNWCRLLTGAILAHELMHAWLRLRGNKDELRYGKEVFVTINNFEHLQAFAI